MYNSMYLFFIESEFVAVKPQFPRCKTFTPSFRYGVTLIEVMFYGSGCTFFIPSPTTERKIQFKAALYSHQFVE